MMITNLVSKLARGSRLLGERLIPPAIDDVRYVNFAATFLCNSRCVTCNIWKTYRGKSHLLKNELTLDEITTFFESPLLRKLQSISLTGGEVFLRPDFARVCGFFLDRFPLASLTIPTGSINPGLSSKTLREIVRANKPAKGRIYISVSLDGIAETHDRQRGIRVFEKAIRVIEEILLIDVFGVGVSFTITRENWRDMERVYRFASDKGIDFSAQFAQNSESYYAKTNLLDSWTSEELQTISHVLGYIADDHLSRLSFHQKAADVRAYFLRRMAVYQANPRRIFTCYSGTHSFYLDPYGNVYPCIVLGKKCGNVRQQSFEEIWLSPKAQAVRRSIAARECYCWTPCESLLSLGRSTKPVLFNLALRSNA